MSAKPRFVLVEGRPIPAPSKETPLQAALRRYGRPFASEPWPLGEGVRYWTSERVARLAAANEEIRLRRSKA